MHEIIALKTARNFLHSNVTILKQSIASEHIWYHNKYAAFCIQILSFRICGYSRGITYTQHIMPPYWVLNIELEQVFYPQFFFFFLIYAWYYSMMPRLCVDRQEAHILNGLLEQAVKYVFDKAMHILNISSFSKK